MTRSTARARIVASAGAAGAALVAVVLAGCGSGRSAQTAYMAPAVAGVMANVMVDRDDVISLRDAQIAPPPPGGYRAGDSAPLRFTLVNDTRETITLNEVQVDNPTGPPPSAGPVTGAECVTQVGGAAAATPRGSAPGPAPHGTPSASAIPGATPSVRLSGSPTASPRTNGAVSPSPTTSPGAATSASVSPGPSATAPGSPSGPAGCGPIGVQLAPGDHVSLVPEAGAFLQVVGLRQLLVNNMPQPLVGGAPGITLTFKFSLPNGNTVHTDPLTLPIGVPASPPARSPIDLTPSQ